jgi:hypothetical protein
MTPSIHAASVPACTASTSPASRPQKRFHLSAPTLLETIGIMAADGQPLPTSFHAARLECARRPELALRTGNPSSGPEVRAGFPVKATPTSIASGPAYAPSQARLDNWKRMVAAKPSSRPIAIHPSRRQGMSARAGPFS